MKAVERKGPWMILRARLSGPFVSRKKSPTKLYPTLSEAFEDAVGFAWQHPGSTFSVFECIGQVIEEKPLEKPAEPDKVEPVRGTIASEKFSKFGPAKRRSAKVSQ